MATIIQYFPTFCDFESEIVDFNTNEELLAIPFVNSFTKDREFVRFIIYDYSYDKTSDRRYLIMAQYKNKERWGVGFFDSIDELNLIKIQDEYKDNDDTYIMKIGDEDEKE